MSQSTALQAAYQHCLQITRGHYENFPVASWFLPKHLRQPISVIYAFARTADDIADEGDMNAEQRLAKLEHYEQQLANIQSGNSVEDPIFMALADVIKHYALPVHLFHDLLSAFKQDVTKKRYANFGEVMDYCKVSANPVGRLLLHLYGETDPKHLAMSDAICSALQLINFYQDLHQDIDENDRIYLPDDEMAQYHVTADHLRHQTNDANLQALMRVQLDRAMKLMKAGAPLGNILKGRIGFELRMVILGGTYIAQQLVDHPAHLFARPRLTKPDLARIAFKALITR